MTKDEIRYSICETPNKWGVFRGYAGFAVVSLLLLKFYLKMKLFLQAVRSIVLMSVGLYVLLLFVY